MNTNKKRPGDTESLARTQSLVYGNRKYIIVLHDWQVKLVYLIFGINVFVLLHVAFMHLMIT